MLLVLPLAPAHAQDSPTVAQLSSPRAHEILLRGHVESMDTARRQFVMTANEFVLPSGRSASLFPPRRKIVSFAGNAELQSAAGWPGTPAAVLTWQQVQLGWVVAVTGDDTGTGQVIPARYVVVAPPLNAPAAAATPTPQRPEPPRIRRTPRPSRPAVAPVISAPGPEAAYPDSRFFGGVKDWVAASGRRVQAKFGIQDIGGRAERGTISEHPRGLALDFMVDRDAARGDAVATYFQQHAFAENVLYIIWKDHLVHSGDRLQDWAKIPPDYTHDVTKRHMDHVHVSYKATPLQ